MQVRKFIDGAYQRTVALLREKREYVEHMAQVRCCACLLRECHDCARSGGAMALCQPAITHALHCHAFARTDATTWHGPPPTPSHRIASHRMASHRTRPPPRATQALLQKEVLNLDAVEGLLGVRPFANTGLQNIDRYRCVAELLVGRVVWGSWGVVSCGVVWCGAARVCPAAGGF